LAKSAASPRRNSVLSVQPGTRAPGVCVPWSDVRAGIGEICGDEQICRDVWNRIDAMGNMFIWTLFLVF
jgi:hypothetical protein